MSTLGTHFRVPLKKEILVKNSIVHQALQKATIGPRLTRMGMTTTLNQRYNKPPARFFGGCDSPRASPNGFATHVKKCGDILCINIPGRVSYPLSWANFILYSYVCQMYWFSDFMYYHSLCFTLVTYSL